MTDSKLHVLSNVVFLNWQAKRTIRQSFESHHISYKNILWLFY